MSNVTRRSFFGLGLKVSVVGAAALGLGACAKQPAEASTACADASNLNASEQSLRASFKYVEQSADPAKVCGGCEFFTADASGSACGDCKILTGAANSLGYCTSWAARAAALPA